MASQDVFWINVALGVIFVAIFLIRRGSRAPTRLNMRAGGPLSKTPMTQKNGGISAEAQSAGSVSANEKSLNVLFNYNGHTWDAFEVLGLPAGAGAKLVDEAYAKACSQTSKDGREFLESAYQAIRSQTSR